jgi:hypothetical protein
VSSKTGEVQSLERVLEHTVSRPAKEHLGQRWRLLGARHKDSCGVNAGFVCVLVHQRDGGEVRVIVTKLAVAPDLTVSVTQAEHEPALDAIAFALELQASD